MNKEKQKIVPELRFAGFNDEWQLKSLSKCADVIDPHPSHRAPAAVSSGVPFIGIGDISENGELDTKNVRLVSSEIYDEHTDRYQLKNGDFAYGRVASVGKVVDLSNNVDKIYTYSPTLAIIQPKSINSKYLKIFCESGFFVTQVKSKTSGSTRKSIGMQNLRILKIAIPKNEIEQQKIANCLSSLDNVITAETEKLDHLKDHKKGLLQQLFPAKGETKPQYRFPEFKNDGDWEGTILDEVADYENGKAHEKEISANGKYKVVNSKFISRDGKVVKFTDSANLKANVGDVLMVLSDIPNGKAIAKCFYVDKDDTYTVNQRICKITPTDIDNKFLFYLQNRNSYFLAFDDGVKQTNLRKDTVLSFPFLKPKDRKEQQKIASSISGADDLIEEQISKLVALKDHKKGLMQQLFPNVNSLVI